MSFVVLTICYVSPEPGGIDAVLDPGPVLSLRAAACMLAGDARDTSAGIRVRRAVDAQLRRAGVELQDSGDVRTEVVLALLTAPAADLRLPLELVCARAAVIARNKAVDHGRRSARAPIAVADLPEPAAEGARPGSLADGLDDVVAFAHMRRVRSDLARALDGLEPSQRAAISAHAEGGAAGAAGLPRSTYYRVLAHAQARLRSDLRGRLTGLGALGDLARGARELFAHAEATHAAVVAGTAVVAATAAVGVGVGLTGGSPPPLTLPPTPVQSLGGRSQPPPPPVPATHTLVVRGAAAARVRPATSVKPARPSPAATRAAAAVAAAASGCSYDPSAYEC